MNKIIKFLLIVIIFIGFNSIILAQKRTVNEFGIDSLYREDQIYAGVTYNLLGELPSGVSQSGFSSGFHFGFIRDMPINKRRNVAIGLGIGYSANSFNQNLFITRESENKYLYTIIDNDVRYSKNKFNQHLIEFPLEFRWRSSSYSEYKFWRIYLGFKTSYVIANSSKYEGSPDNLKINNISDFNDFQYGLTFSAGYNTWNFYLYYALNPIFNSNAVLNNNSIDVKAIKIGLMFYVL